MKLLIISTVLITVAAGVILRYFDLDTFIIILGFRFHIGIIFPLVFVIWKIPVSKIKTFFTSPRYKGNLLPILWITVPLILTLIFYLSGRVHLTDPVYFYEFGISSLIDYPLYLIWNMLQFSVLFIFLQAVSENFRLKVTLITITVLLLFIYELIHFDTYRLYINEAGAFLLLALSSALIVRYFSNVYWFTLSIFSTLWCALLLFGTGSETMIKILFASKYSNWEGFAATVQSFDFPIFLYIGCFPLLLTASIVLRKTRKSV